MKPKQKKPKNYLGSFTSINQSDIHENDSSKKKKKSGYNKMQMLDAKFLKK